MIINLKLFTSSLFGELVIVRDPKSAISGEPWLFFRKCEKDTELWIGKTMFMLSRT